MENKEKTTNQNQKTDDSNNKLKNIFLKDGWVTAFSAVSAGLLAVFSFIAYWFEVSYLNFWDIPTDFIHADNKDGIYRIIAAVCVSAVILFISYHANAFVTQIKCIWGKLVCLIVVYILYSIYCCMVFTFWLMSSTDVSLDYWDTFITWMCLPPYCILIFLIAFILIVPIFSNVLYSILSAIIHFFRRKNLNNSKCSSKKNRKKREKRTSEEKYKLFMSVMYLILATAFIFLCFAIYDSLINQYENTTTFDIIDNQYVVLYKDTDTFVVKECCIHRDGENDKIYINTDAYRLIDAKDIEVQTIHLSSEDKQVFDLCTAEEYAAHLASESPAHETSG